MIESFREEMREKSAIREELLSSSRKITFLSKQAIMAMHRSEPAEAKVKLAEAGKMLRKIEESLSSHQDLITGSMRTAYQEYAEAQIFLKVVEEDEFPTPKAINVPTAQYLLGLADAIGEFRRRALDSLRKRRLRHAEKCLQTMDDIYVELVSLEEAYAIVPELRRKCDIARRLIELTMGEIATEARRSSLEKSIKLLEKRMDVERDEAKSE
jgi:translin